MNDSRFPRRAVVALVALLTITSCSLTEPKEDPVSTKRIEKSAQTDPAPVLERTQGLPEDADFLWYSGTLGSGAPGPSTYWVDARLSTTEEAMDDLRAQCPDGTVSEPDVVDELSRELVDEGYAECPAVAGEIALKGWDTHVWISQNSPVMVITLVGQG